MMTQKDLLAMHMEDTLENLCSLTDLKSQVPPGLVTESILQISTTLGKSVIVGRKSDEYAKSILGLNGFYAKIKTIYYAAKADNPFADAVLLKVESEMRQVNNYYQQIIARVNEHHTLYVKQDTCGTNSVYRIECRPSGSAVSVRLNYKLYYGHAMAQVVALYDQIAMRYLELVAHAQISKKHYYQIMQKMGKPIRRIYRYGQFWKHFAVKRADVKAGTQTYTDAREYFSKTFGLQLSMEIVEKITLPEWGPGR